MEGSTLVKLCVVLALARKLQVSAARSIAIQSNSYSGIVLAIHPNISEDPELVLKLRVSCDIISYCQSLLDLYVCNAA